MQWHSQTPEQIFAGTESTSRGLTTTEAASRLARFGPNQLNLRKEPLWKLILEPFRSIFIVVLLAAAIVSFASGEIIDGVIVLIIIVINAVIFYTQQYATSRVLRSLRRHSIQEVFALRDDKRTRLSSLALVPGDIIFLSEGERVPADARLLTLENLQLDESSLTGESQPITKATATLSGDKPVYERRNLVFQGTHVTAGTGQAIVVETGARTEFGRIAGLAASGTGHSPVQQKIDTLIARLIKVLGVVAIIVFVLSLVRGIPTIEALRFVLALSVAAVPEGLPVALTVIIVLGMRRMAKQHALVRSFKAIEDIGLVTTIATDKTGTLTRNHLEVKGTWSRDADFKAAVTRTIDPNAGAADPLDTALSEYTGPSHRTQPDRFYPFSLALRQSGAYYADTHTLYLKGAPEQILSLAKLSRTEHAQAEAALDDFASRGYRVIAIASCRVPEAPKSLTPAARAKAPVTLHGFIACADSLRREAKAALRDAAAAGIQVKLITGDHFETAYHIGHELNLARSRDQVIVGHDLPKSLTDLAAIVKAKSVFARILPEDKFRILQALKQTEITAMTGDGVNDVPALAGAHVGIAMGSGSDIAKDAGGIILLKDNFSTIITALSEGRKIFDNIRRMLYYLLTTSLSEIITMIGALLIGLPLPVTALQVLWINLVTDTAMVLPLGLEPAEDGHMRRPPRRPTDPLLSRALIIRMVLIGTTMAIITLITVAVLRARGYDTASIQTVAFMVLIVGQWANAFNARSEFQSLFARLKRPNYGLIAGLSVAAVLQVLVMFGPLASVFHIQAVDSSVLLTASAIMVVAVILAGELHKAACRRLNAK